MSKAIGLKELTDEVYEAEAAFATRGGLSFKGNKLRAAIHQYLLRFVRKNQAKCGAQRIGSGRTERWLIKNSDEVRRHAAKRSKGYQHPLVFTAETSGIRTTNTSPVNADIISPTEVTAEGYAQLLSELRNTKRKLSECEAKVHTLERKQQRASDAGKSGGRGNAK